jgi:hypothetical protein
MRKIAIVVALVGLMGCGVGVEAPRVNVCRPPVAAEWWPRTRVVLVTIDGVRWQEVFLGTDPMLFDGPSVDAAHLLPNLHALAERGLAAGAPGEPPFQASGPNFVSLPGYREIVSGHADADCHNNECGQIATPTLLDELRAAGLPPEQIAAIGSWERLERAASIDPAAVTVSVGRHHGASRDRLRVSERAAAILDAGQHSGAWPGWFDYRPDVHTSALALEYAAVVRPRFLWVGLGDTDELAHRGDYLGYLEALRRFDAFLGELSRTFDEHTLVIVTTDHGRARNFRDHGGHAPESRATWLIAAGPGVRSNAPAPLTRLADIAPLVRRAFGIPPTEIASR